MIDMTESIAPRSDQMNADGAPPCGLCGRPRRWISRRGEYSLYCAGQNCSATERQCKTCDATFTVGAEGTKPRQCKSCASWRTEAKPKVDPPSWSGRAVKMAREHVQATLPASCGKCGAQVDGSEAWVTGHILSRATHPELTFEPTNWQAEHRRCSDSSAQAAVREIAYRDGFADGWVSALRDARVIA